MTINDIKDDIDFLCGSTSASYPVADKIRNINIAYQDVARIIWESADGWQYDDSNLTTRPVAIATLVHTQQDYELPSVAQHIERVEVKDSAGDWYKLTPLDIHDVTGSIEEYYEDDDLPKYYDLVGRSLMLYPAPASGSCTLASGLAVYVDRDVNEFDAAVSAHSAKVPGFATQFHRVLSYAAAVDFVQDDNMRKHLVNEKYRLEKGLTKFYSRRNIERRGAIKPHAKKLWRQYL